MATKHGKTSASAEPSAATVSQRDSRWRRLPPKAVFDACDGLVNGMKIEDIADMLSATVQEAKIHRTQIRHVIAEGVRRGYLQLTPPTDEALARELSLRFRNVREAKAKPKQIKVVLQSYDVSLERVAAAAAEMAFDVISDCFRRKNPRQAGGGKVDADRIPVSLGFGAGRTLTMVASHLAHKLRLEPDRPRIRIHSLTGGFRPEEPDTAPNSFCNFFHDIPEVTYTGLFSTPYVKSRDWKKQCKDTPGVSDSYKERAKIDIIITSLASAGDPHGELNRFITTYEGLRDSAPTSKALVAAQRTGDVMYRPFSETKPIRIRNELRAATLFELDELVEFAKRDDTAVILVAGPCGSLDCRRPRHHALVPILEAPALDLMTHLVTDDVTVRACLELA